MRLNVEVRTTSTIGDNAIVLPTLRIASAVCLDFSIIKSGFHVQANPNC